VISGDCYGAKNLSLKFEGNCNYERVISCHPQMYRDLPNQSLYNSTPRGCCQPFKFFRVSADFTEGDEETHLAIQQELQEAEHNVWSQHLFLLLLEILQWLSLIKPDRLFLQLAW